MHTRPEVASFVLDLAGYRVGRPLHRSRVLEPSFGDGVFLSEICRRLLASWRADGAPGGVGALYGAVRAVEIHRETFERTRTSLRETLLKHGLSTLEAESALDHWLICDDFLLCPFSDGFDAVVGNPPYVRQELIPTALLERYRNDYASVYDRADLYVPFIERGLRLLRRGGRLTYICADRWMKNRYGGPLRGIIADGFDLRHVVGMHRADAFEDDVDAYPSVFTVERPHRGPLRETAVAQDPLVEAGHLGALADSLESGGDGVRRMHGVVSSESPWILDGDEAVALLRALEEGFPTLEEAGCKAGIGVATGADRVFIGKPADLPVEPDRLLPLATARDARPDGTLSWSGKVLVNPFGPDGKLVDLDEYPKLRAYFEANGEVLRRRHVARKSPHRWYRTIDKVHADMTTRPKLLIPDIKGGAVVAYDEGELYPHHNLYVVTSDAWDIRALQTVLRSRIAEFQVAAYCVRMRGGYLRFQAQYLRRIRLPLWSDVPRTLRERLTESHRAERDACDAAAADLYGLTPAQMATVRDETEGT